MGNNQTNSLTPSTDELVALPHWGAPVEVAEHFVARQYTNADNLLLRRHQGQYFLWVGSHWRLHEVADIRKALQDLTRRAVVLTDDRPIAWKPTAGKLGEALKALESVVLLASDTSTPAWVGGKHNAEPTDVIAARNGLLHLPTRRFRQHTPEFWNHSALSFDYDAHAPRPERWLLFLKELWGDDQESIDTLQEFMGYCVTADTSQEKILGLIGPKRSGKGTIGKVLRALVGTNNVAGPTFAMLATPFGLSHLIGKQLAIISDARTTNRMDSGIVVERLLTISGEDFLTIDRKHISAWHGQLPLKFVILSNELPKLADASGALAGRFVLLMLHNNFYGREDTALFGKLTGELPGILNWSLTGLDRLRERGHFNVPASSSAAMRALEALGAPVKSFVEDCCETCVECNVPTAMLIAAYRRWCETHNIVPAPDNVFAKELLAAFPFVKPTKLRDGERRIPAYRGLSLLDAADDEILKIKSILGPGRSG